MKMTLNDFEAKALQVLLSQRFLSLPLFEEEELSEYHIADNQGEMNLEDFIRQYAEVITEQFEADYEKRLKADLVAMLEELKEQLREMHEDFFETEHFDEAYGVSDSMDVIQQKINSLKEDKDGENNY